MNAGRISILFLLPILACAQIFGPGGGISGTVAPTQGGTGLTTAAQGSLLYASATDVFSALAKDTNATRALCNTGTNNNPAWCQISLTTGVTGTLPVGNGGIGVATITGLLKGNGTSPFTAATAADIPATSVPTPGTSITLVAPRGYGICTDTCTVTVPVPAAGYEFCVLNDDNVSTAITLSALGSSAMYENSARTAYGTAGTGTLVVAAAPGNKVCIVGRDSTHYLTVSYQGIVTVN